MQRLIISTCLFLMAGLPLQASSQLKYFGAQSTEAMLRFEGQIDVPRGEDVDYQIEEQLQFLIGHFSSESFKKKYGRPGVAGDTYDVKILSRQARGARTLVKYAYEGKVNFHVDAFKEGKEVTVPIRLPLALDRIYQLGVVRGVNKCTDDHYNSEGDLFYFWDVEKKGCPLRHNKREVQHLTGKLTRMPNTKMTYPEYDRLYQKEELNIAVFMGYVDDEFTIQDPAVYQLQELKQYLKTRRFSVRQEDRQFGPSTDANGEGINYRAVFTKTRLNALGQRQRVNVHVLVADTAIDSQDETFRDGYKRALREADLIVYDGHSGLGANIGTDYIEGLRFKNNYQVLFLNGCSSYPYFNRDYFEQKPGGTKNMEIITSGLSTYSSTATANMLAFLNPFLNGKLTTYQTLLRAIERSNGDVDSYLTGVNGDQDNQFTTR